MMGYAISHIKQAQAVINAAFGDFHDGAIWRNAVEAGGKVGAVALVTTASGWRRPTTYFAQTKRLVPEQWLNSARITQVLQVASTVDIRIGDRWIEDGVTYIVDAPPDYLSCHYALRAGRDQGAGMTIEGLPQLERAIGQLQRIAVPLGQAVTHATQRMQQGVQHRTHVLTGTLQSAQSYRVEGLMGSVFIAAKRNPLSGATTTEYGPIEEARGGSHAAYAGAMEGDAQKVLDEAGEIIVRALP